MKRENAFYVYEAVSPEQGESQSMHVWEKKNDRKEEWSVPTNG